MRKPIVAGNWKMYKTPQQAAEFAAALNAVPGFLADAERADVLVCPPFIAIPGVAAAFSGTPIKVGAQNVHEKVEGAFTSSISAPMLQGLVDYVILGHSEVRQYLKETDAQISGKIKTLLAHQLTPILAVGESLEQKKDNLTEIVVNGQVMAALDGIPAAALPAIVIAYEPIWAIGSGLACEPGDANGVIGGIRAALAAQFGAEAAQAVRIQYGGSVKPDNMQRYMSQPEIDGALVGGASLKVDDFVSLVRAAIAAKG